MNIIFLRLCMLFTLTNVLTVAQNKQPNILFVIADDMSHTSIYGHKFVNTPNFDKIGQQGLVFNNMFTPSSKCAPSRAVILTGRNPWQLEAAANHQPIWPEKFKSFIEVLTENGYFSGFTGKGWNPGVHPVGRNLTGKEYNKKKIDKKPLKGVALYDYTENFKDFIKDRPKNKPFFFWYGCKEPHRGYEYKSGVRLGKKIEDLKFQPSFWPANERVKNDILDYAVEVEYFDQYLGKILKHLEKVGELENTIIIATSDNSMPFPRYKGHPHEFSTRIPFVVSWSGKIKKPGRSCSEFASFIDIAPTLLEVSGIEQINSGMPKIQGKSLTDFFNNNVKGRNTVLTGRERNDMVRPNGWGYPVRSYHKGDYVYMHNFEPNRWPCGEEKTGYRDTDYSPTKAEIMKLDKSNLFHQLNFGKRPKEELYNIKKDPFCMNNLAADKKLSKLKKKMKTALFKELKTQGDPRMFGNGAIFNKARPKRIAQYKELVAKTKARMLKKKK
ncbi:sulfatase family protein [Ochrovirga pacifica]|uniref:sulfatase family protein n=1 Tax=Ochrovirga pacifica TaxID=1042376 RepID=UPI00025583DE|nr:sulfatase [Ochrovirga pacifica]